MAFVCVECGHVFETPATYGEKHGLETPPYEHMRTCPNCGGAFCKATVCDGCGEVITSEYVRINNGSCYCDNCFSLHQLGDEG